MNEHEVTSTDAPQAESQPPQGEPARGGMSPLRIVLLLILALMIAALVWDWGVARPASQEAYDKVSEMVAESASRPAEGGQASREDVKKVIGREPSTVFDGGHYLAEEYHWIRGLPFKSYYVIVIYNKREGGSKFTLANVELNQALEDISKPGAPVVVDPKLSEEDQLVEGQPGEVDPAQSEGADDVSPPLAPGEEPAPVETPAEEPAPDAPAPDAPAPDSPAPEEPAPDAPAPDAPAPDAPAPETPAPDAPAPDAPEPPAAEDAPDAPAPEPPAEETPAPPAEGDKPEEPAPDDAPAAEEKPDAPQRPMLLQPEEAPEAPAAEETPAEETPAESDAEASAN